MSRSKSLWAGAQPARKWHSRQNSSATLQIKPQFPEKQKNRKILGITNLKCALSCKYNYVFSIFLISFNLLLCLKFPEKIHLFLADLLLFNFSYYLLILKTFEAAVLVDRSGVHPQAFRLKKFDIPYEEIESITSYRLEKRSKEMSLLLIIGGIALCGFVVYMAVVKGEWKMLLLLISLLPLILFAAKKQKTQLWDLNTQL